MKTDKPDLEVISTITGDEVKMTVDESALVHIMSILTDLYSDPEMAVIREYSTNAYDAHVEAGQTRPIEITTPTTLSPFLVIQDYGIGLSGDDIHNIYSKYGASTKRDTNAQVGMLGLGCKAALTYASQFTLIGVKNGIMTSVSVARNEDGAGSLTIMEERQVSDPDGVKITIPAQRWNDIERKAARFFQFWPAGTVLLNGKEPEFPAQREIAKNIYTVERASEHYIVMGNVPYPVKLDVNLNHNFKIVAYVPIGAVNFTPSREELHYTNKTKAVIAEIEKSYAAGLQASIQSQIDAAGSKPEALKAYQDAVAILPNPSSGTYYYNGVELPRQIDVAGTFWVPTRSYKLSEHSGPAPIKISAWSLPNSVWFHGYNATTFTSLKKKKLNQWLEEKGFTSVSGSYGQGYRASKDKKEVERFGLCGTKLACDWIDQSQWYDWADVEAIKIARNFSTGHPSGRPVGAYDVYKYAKGKPVGGLTATLAAELDRTNLFWYQGPIYEAQDYLAGLHKNLKDFTLVPLPLNRVDKFKRIFPEAREVDSYLTECYNSWMNGLSSSVRLALHAQINWGRTAEILPRFDPEKIKDPALKKGIKAVVLDVRKEKQIIREYQNCLNNKAVPYSPSPDPLKQYPLIHHNYHLPINQHKSHIYDYFNMVYEKTQKEKAQCNTQS